MHKNNKIFLKNGEVEEDITEITKEFPTAYFASGVVKRKTTLKNGKLYKEVVFFERGGIRRITHYNSNGRKDGHYKRFNQNGDLAAAWFYQNGRKFKP